MSQGRLREVLLFWSRIICSTVILPKKTTVFPFTSQRLQLVSWRFFTNPFFKICDRQKWVHESSPIFQGENSTKICEALIHHLDNLEKPDHTRHCHRWRGGFFFRFVQLYRHPYMCMPGCIGIGGLVNVSFLSSHQMKSWVNSKEILTKVYKKLVGGFNLGEKYWSNWIISPTITRGKNKKCLKPPRKSLVMFHNIG